MAMARVVKIDHLGSGYWAEKAEEQTRLGHYERALHFYAAAREAQDSVQLRSAQAEVFLFLEAPSPARRLY